jgi:hypothetical protein
MAFKIRSSAGCLPMLGLSRSFLRPFAYCLKQISAPD